MATSKERSRAWYERNRRRVTANSTAWAKAHPNRRREIQRKSDKKYAVARAKTRKVWLRANKVLVRAQQRRTRAKHPYSKREAIARLKARRLQQECTCCSTAQLRAVYKLAHLAGKQVDHKKALGLGGLHCRKNMQLLTIAEHRRKSIRDYAKWSALQWPKEK